MDAPHDMGGTQGYGPIVQEPEHEQAGLGHFHEDWEKRVLGMSALVIGAGIVSIEQARYARERQFPANYLTRSYWETWLYGLVLNLIETKTVTADEMIKMGLITQEELDMALKLRADALAEPIAEITPKPETPRFRVGDAVRSITQRPSGHTRETHYARGHVGVIEYVYDADDPAQEAARTYADVRGTTGKDEKQWLYSVRFKASELWGIHADNSGYVYVNMWEPYLEPAE